MYTPAAFQTLNCWEALSATLEQDVWEHFSSTVFLSWNSIFSIFSILVQFHNIYLSENWETAIHMMTESNMYLRECRACDVKLDDEL